MKSIKQTFSVAYEYQLYFTKQLFDPENDLFYQIIAGFKSKTPSKLLVVVDSGVAAKHPNLYTNIRLYCDLYPDTLTHTKTITVPGGEGVKNDTVYVDQVLQEINNQRIDRHSFVIVIGGGAVIDMVGYAAAIAHRGVKLIRVPTTVLSQNDSAVGVKNSVNAFGKKNFLGTFAPPFAIINDTHFLSTLEQRDWISGIAEAIKVALIKDLTFFEYLEAKALQLRNRDEGVMNYTIAKCAEMHMQHIATGGDPFESGSSRPLDFGHWAAHKLEYMTAYSLRHGEAVAMGIALDVSYAHLLGILPKSALERILKMLTEIGFNLKLPLETEADIAELLGGLQEFQEHLGGELCITLIDSIGTKKDVNSIDLDKMKIAIKSLTTMGSLKYSN